MTSLHLPDAPGTLVSIGDRRLHFLGAGDPGDTDKPTVLLDSGLGGNSLFFTRVLPATGAFTYALAHDRAGYPWSDPLPASTAATSAQAVEDMRALLAALGRKPPWVLAGLSYGGINMLTFALRYPQEVAGMVLIEPSAPEMFTRVPGVPNAARMTQSMRLLRGAARGGWLRRLPAAWRLGLIAGTKLIPAAYLPAWHAIVANPRIHDAALAETLALDASLAAARAGKGALGAMPLIVLSGMKMWGEGKGSTRLVSRKQKQAMLTLRQELADLSGQGEHRMIMDGGHLLPLEQPLAVAEAIRAICKRID